MSETIFALSSGSPPAAIAVIRISGPRAGAALQQLAGALPRPRTASLRRLRSAGEILDSGLVLWFPGPDTATGEDLAELHCHGGRAVVAAVEAALAGLPGLRRATPGEFTRRAFVNGRIDLAEAEGLADLLTAETELQRRSALAMAGGQLSGAAAGWRDRLLHGSALIEAVLDFSDEDDVSDVPAAVLASLGQLGQEIGEWLARPSAERLREGFRVTIAGPPNAGKSTLFNALVQTEAAITAPVPGTTRDVLTHSVAFEGVPFLFIDTAGLRDDTADPIEAIGVARAQAELANADLVLWLGAEGEGPPRAWEIEPRVDCVDAPRKSAPRHRLSALTGAGVDTLRADLVLSARQALPLPSQAALNRRQHELLGGAAEAIARAGASSDLLLVAEELRSARAALDALLGRTGTEDMLDTLFGRLCIGK